MYTFFKSSVRLTLVALMVTSLFFGVMFSTPAYQAEAQTQSHEEMMEMINQLMAMIALLQAQLESQTGTPTVTSTAIGVGDTVRTTDNLTIRNNPGGERIGVASVGEEGQVVEGPSSLDGRTWWKVDYEVGPTGWSAANWLTKVNSNVITPDPEPEDGECYSHGQWWPEGTQKTQITNASGTATSIIDAYYECDDGEWEIRGSYPQPDLDGTLRVQTSSNDPDSTTFQLDSTYETNHEVFVFELEGDDADFTVDEIKIEVEGEGSANDLRDVLYNAEILVDGQELDNYETLINSNYVRFELGDLIEVDEDIEVEVSINFEFEAMSYIEPGTTIQLSVDDSDVKLGDISLSTPNVDVVGGATGEEHTLVLAGVLVEVVDTGAYVSQTSSVGGHGEFEIEMDVTAFGDDIYVYQSNSFGKDGVIPVKVVESDGGEADGDLSFTIDTTADTEGAFMVIKEGETEEIVVIADFTPDTDGVYRMEINKLPYVVGQAGGSVSYTDVDDGRTDYIFINGSDVTPEPDLATYKGYMNGDLFITTNNINYEDALENCKLNAENNPTKEVYCTWNGDEIYRYTPEDDSSRSELHVIGVYQAAEAAHSFCKSEWGGVEVTLDSSLGDGPISLVLSSYEPVQWSITNQSEIEIDEIYLTGYNPQKVTGAGSADVSWKTYYKKNSYTQGGEGGQGAFYSSEDSWPATIYHWASSCDESAAIAPESRRYLKANSGYVTGYSSSNNSDLLNMAKEWTGLDVTSFQGSYSGSHFTVGSNDGVVQGASTSSNYEMMQMILDIQAILESM